MIITQTDKGLATANSYVSAADLLAYATARGIALNGNPDQLLVKAMDYIESKTYKSEPLNNVQLTAFPRKAYGLPERIKQAQLALAVIADTNDLMPNLLAGETNILAEKVGDIEVRYSEPKRMAGVQYLTQPDRLLEPYIKRSEQGFGNVRVYRG